MSPEFLHGEIVRVDTSYYNDKDPELGHVVAKHPYIKDHLMVKKITKISDQGYFLEGTNKATSTDSRIFGYIKRSSILGKVLDPIE